MLPPVPLITAISRCTSDLVSENNSKADGTPVGFFCFTAIIESPECPQKVIGNEDYWRHGQKTQNTA